MIHQQFSFPIFEEESADDDADDPNNSGIRPGPCPIAPRDQIRRAGKPLTSICIEQAKPVHRRAR